MYSKGGRDASQEESGIDATKQERSSAVQTEVGGRKTQNQTAAAKG